MSNLWFSIHFKMVLHILQFFSCILLAVAWQETNSDQFCDGSTLDCRSHSEISHMIDELKKENQGLRQVVDINCTVCWSAPCHNGGTCVPVDFSHYRCDCGDHYAGPSCETYIECKPESCGRNAQCYVANHQINCVCNTGYSGNAKYGCDMHTVKACASGDPHFITFDGQHYEYQGTCPYVYLQPCNGTLPHPFAYFSVKAKNELTYARAHVSSVKEVEVEMYGQVLHLDDRFHLYVNGVRHLMPFYYPSRTNPRISVEFGSSGVNIKNDQFVEVTFGNGMICVEIPDVPLLQGADRLCGLAGNRDMNCQNDFRNRDGSVYHSVSSCSNRNTAFTEQFGDTWITDDFMALKTDTTCLTGQEVFNETLDCNLVAVKEVCQQILDASRSKGPFARCQPLGIETIQNAYDNCVFDVCARKELYCTSMTTFAKICQVTLPNTPLDWRNALHCPNLHCPLHSKASPCATGCPATCMDPVYTESCTKGCTEGCECYPGYVLDTSSPLDIKCIRIEECGCVDPNGNPHLPSGHWLTNNCTQYNYCSNATYHYHTEPCSADAYCSVDGTHDYKCECNKGFTGDGYDCTDIDECLDGTKCSSKVGKGICINTRGSYKCECIGYYGGAECASYLPSRHCADLYTFHNITSNGVYTIYPASINGTHLTTEGVSVYCDMITQGGGWTLMANSMSNLTAHKTYEQYIEGFGDPEEQDVWIGLELIRVMTHEMNTSLRVDLHRCKHNSRPATSTFCTYPTFKVLGKDDGYAVFIPDQCSGTESIYFDGWARWNLSQTGPRFLAYDNDNSVEHCSSTYMNTGWWFDTTQLCGSANLNGERYSCENVPDVDELAHYLRWNGNPLSGARLYLRPQQYPSYDPYHI